MEVIWDECCSAALGIGFEAAKWREVRTLAWRRATTPR